MIEIMKNSEFLKQLFAATGPFIRLNMAYFLLVGFSMPQKESDIIYWNSQRYIQWSDFRGKYKSNQDSVTAMSYVGILIRKNTVGTLGVYSAFSKDKSWVDPNERTEAGLGHEQGHFDITEICARKFRKYLLENKRIARSEKRVEKAYREFQIMHLNLQSRYDRDTDHNRNEEERRKWKSLIEQELEALAAFKNPIINF